MAATAYFDTRLQDHPHLNLPPSRGEEVRTLLGARHTTGPLVAYSSRIRYPELETLAKEDYAARVIEISSIAVASALR